MGTVLVVVALVGGQDLPGVGLADDEDVIEYLAPDGADHSFAAGVYPGSSRRALEDVHLLSLEDGVEGSSVFAVAVAEQEAQVVRAPAEVGCRVPCLLHCPLAGGVGGDAGDVQAPGAVFEERERVQTPAECGIDVEEVHREDALGLSGEEVGPGGAGAAGGWVDARGVEDLPYRGCGDGVAESGELALDTLVPPVGSPEPDAAPAS